MAEVTRLAEILRRVSTDLAARGARFALVGGFAVSARTEPRFTRDLDFAVSVEGDPEAEALVRILTSAGYIPGFVAEQEATHRLASVRLQAPAGGLEAVMVDLLFASSGIEPEIVRGADELELVPGLSMPIASVGHLIALKILSRDDRRRPQDAADLRALVRAAAPADLALAREAIAAITQRGYHRNRDLPGGLERALADSATDAP
jgi:predicted nucleotidyltransferase